MKSTIVSIQPEVKNYIYIVAGLVLIVAGLLLIHDFILTFFRLFIGLIMIVVGIFLFNYEKNKYGFRFFRF